MNLVVLVYLFHKDVMEGKVDGPKYILLKLDMIVVEEVVPILAEGGGSGRVLTTGTVYHGGNSGGSIGEDEVGAMTNSSTQQ
jgi:hypothetical protein